MINVEAHREHSDVTTLRWRYKGGIVEVRVLHYDVHTVSKRDDYILVLTKADSKQANASSNLMVFGLEGNEVARFLPHKGYCFYRFEEHFKSEIGTSIVCIGHPDKFHRDAWHFSIDVDNKKLEFIGLSY